MSKLILLTASLLSLTLGCSSTRQAPPNSPGAQPQSLRLHISSATYPPYVDTEGKPRAALDLVATALARAGYIADNEIAPLEAVIAGLKSDKYAGSAALWRSEEREQFLLYSQPFLENRIMLVGRAGSDVSATSFAQLKDKKIGVVVDYAYGPELDNATEPSFVRGVSSEENLRDLLRGKLDYVLVDALVLHHLAHQYPQETRTKLALGSTPLLKRTLHFAVRKNLPNAALIINGFNAQIAKMLADGSYHTALHVDWIHADIDGDGKPELVASGDQLGTEPPSAGYRPVSGPEGEGAEGPRFVVKGVAYDSWQAVPGDYKTAVNTPGNTPATMRASVFEF